MNVTISQMLLLEFDEEMAATRRILAQIPDDKYGWRPHVKSQTVAGLVSQLAMIPAIPAMFFKGLQVKRVEPASSAELLLTFDTNANAGRSALMHATEDQLSQIRKISAKESRPTWSILKRMMMNHSIHHRGQLTVYMRLLDLPVPGLYGLSADD